MQLAINQLPPEKSDDYYENICWEQIVTFTGIGTFKKNLIDDKSILDNVMAWWHSPMMPYGIIKP